jgi:indole-3-glycerol phosphate synthase
MSVLITHFEQSDLDSALNLSTQFIDILSRDLQTEEINVIAC